MQPVQFTPEDSDGSSAVVIEMNDDPGVHLSVQNRYSFLNLDHLDWTWAMTSNRSPQPVQTGSFFLKDAEGGQDTFVILQSAISIVVELEKSRPVKGNSYFLRLEGSLKEDTSWGKAGRVVTTQQLPLTFAFRKPISFRLPVPPRNDPPEQVLSLPITYRSVNDMIHIERPDENGPVTLAVLDPSTGGIESIFSRSGEDMLVEQVLPNFVRAATDNDNGGLENLVRFFFPNFNIKHILGNANKHFSFASHWRRVGLDPSSPPTVTCYDLRMRHVANQVFARAYCEIKNQTNEKILFLLQIDYNVWGDGRLRVHYHLTPTDAFQGVVSLPRVGVHMGVDAPYCKVSYFGKGPEENYPDRQAASHFGHYETTPQKMGHNKYIVPGEYGSRSDCEWIALRHVDTGTGMLVVMDDEPFSFSALHHSAAELDQANHTHELLDRGDSEDMIHVNVDHQIMGVGGDMR